MCIESIVPQSICSKISETSFVGALQVQIKSLTKMVHEGLKSSSFEGKVEPLALQSLSDETVELMGTLIELSKKLEVLNYPESISNLTSFNTAMVGVTLDFSSEFSQLLSVFVNMAESPRADADFKFKMEVSQLSSIAPFIVVDRLSIYGVPYDEQASLSLTKIKLMLKAYGFVESNTAEIELLSKEYTHSDELGIYLAGFIRPGMELALRNLAPKRHPAI